MSWYFLQNSATANTTCSINTLQDVFRKWLIICKLWPSGSPDLKIHHHVCRVLKYRVGMNNPHSLWVKIIRIITNCCHTDAGRSLNGYKENYNWNICPHNNPGRCTQIVMVILGRSKYLTYTYTNNGFRIMTQSTCLYYERIQATSALTVGLCVM
jgi:hypothetical protein